MNNLVSIITPCYSNASFIAETIESVIAQSYEDWEMIIVDDNSTDTSADIIRAYTAKDRRIKFIPLVVNSGAENARNTAIEAAKGRYIAFLDSDDLWLTDKLEQQLKFMKTHHLAFTYASYQLMDENSRVWGKFITPTDISYHSLLKTCDIGCLTALYDSQKLGKIYMSNTDKKGDYILWLQILKQIQITKGIKTPLAIYRVRKNSLSGTKIKQAMLQWRVYRNVEKLSFGKSCYYFLFYAYFGWIKYH